MAHKWYLKLQVCNCYKQIHEQSVYLSLIKAQPSSSMVKQAMKWAKLLSLVSMFLYFELANT